MLRNALIVVLVVALVAALGWGWRKHDEAAKAENTLGLDSTRIVAASFAKARALKVYTVGGAVLSQVGDDGFFGMLPSAQKTRLPFTVDYFVDLASLGPRSYIWDERRRTVTVDVPDVTIAAPNIDATRSETTQTGLIVTRSAGLRLQQATAKAVAMRAREFAARPENVDKARTSARGAVASLTAVPLQAAGLGTVHVVVRFPFEARGSTEPWDESRPLAQVLTGKDSQK